MKKITKEDILSKEFCEAMNGLKEHIELKKQQIKMDIHMSKFEKLIELKRLEKEVNEKIKLILKP